MIRVGFVRPGSRSQRNHQSAVQGIQQVILHIDEIRVGFAGLFVGVYIQVELAHQKTLYLSANKPCLSANALHDSIPFLFSASHFLLCAARTSFSSACSRVADKLIFNWRASVNNSILMLRLVGFFGALLSNTWCIVMPDVLYYAHIVCVFTVSGNLYLRDYAITNGRLHTLFCSRGQLCL